MARKKMDQEFKKKWVEKLRSGRFTQGRTHLKSKRGKTTSYCCLGVAYQALGLKWEKKGGRFLTSSEFKIAQNRRGYYLPHSLSENIGISHDTQAVLAGMNDDGISFNEIANWIEENL